MNTSVQRLLFLCLQCIAIVSCRSLPPSADSSAAPALNQTATSEANDGKTESKVITEENQVDWKKSMNRLRVGLLELDPYLFNSAKFEDELNQKSLTTKIHSLAEEAKSVKHNPMVEQKDPTLRYVASQFSNHLQRADRHFSEGRKQFAREYLIKVKSDCVQCHLRMPEGRHFFAPIFQKESLTQLSPLDRAEFLITQRSFNEAFTELTNLMKKEQNSMDQSYQLFRGAYLGLQLSVQYLKSPQKTELFVQQILNNKSMTSAIRNKAENWKK